MKVTDLRVTGFKSFVDPVSLKIEPGLTGIVGPNGCGKSNILESLRWVMGATSARALRGGEMDDVIFAGTDKRPQRDIAEVSIVLDNSDGRAPAPFNTSPTLEVTLRLTARKYGHAMCNCCLRMPQQVPTRLPSCAKTRSAS
jgi:chromosome segregation protein